MDATLRRDLKIMRGQNELDGTKSDKRNPKSTVLILNGSGMMRCFAGLAGYQRDCSWERQSLSIWPRAASTWLSPTKCRRLAYLDGRPVRFDSPRGKVNPCRAKIRPLYNIAQSTRSGLCFFRMSRVIKAQDRLGSVQ
jgi:hypothetical protein